MKKEINISFPGYIRWDGVIPTFVKGYNRTLIVDTEKKQKGTQKVLNDE